MPIQKVISDQRVPVKIWTDDVDGRRGSDMLSER